MGTVVPAAIDFAIFVGGAQASNAKESVWKRSILIGRPLSPACSAGSNLLTGLWPFRASCLSEY